MTRRSDRPARCGAYPWMRRLLLGALLAVTPAAIPRAARAQFPPDSFTNLKVLPQDIDARELVSMMAGFTRALGVRCTHCHVGEESLPLAEYDFASDEKPPKRKAREMIGMVGRINDVHLAGLEERASPPVRVECFTCHRGVPEPRTLQQRVATAYEVAGIDSAVATYEGLRERYYGRASFDFGEVTLVDVAGEIAARGDLADAERLHDLNVRMNPGSAFARSQFVTVALERAFLQGGAEAGRARHAELRQRFGGEAFPERLLNALGYSLLRRERTSEAVEAFRINADAYPRSSNVFDSLGEALAAGGDLEQAIRSYERALELDPSNANAIEKLRELRGRMP